MPDRAIDELLALDEARLRRLLEAGRSLVAHLDLEGVLENLLAVATELTGARHAAIGDPPPGRGVLGVPIVIRGEAWGQLYLTEKQDAAEFTVADQQTATVLAGWAGIAIDNARLFEGVQTRKDELERAVQGLEATTAIVRAIGAETDVDRVLELIVTRGRALIDARSLVLLLAEGAELVVAASAGQVESRAVGSRIPIEGTAAGQVLSGARPTRMSDAQTMLELEDAGLGVVGAETGMLVPLVYRQHALGMLAAFDSMTGDGEFDAEQESLLVTFAASAATAVATAKTVERERLHDSLAAAESERRRWARELHDDTLQGLAGLRVLLASAGPEADRASVDHAVEVVATQIQEQIDGLRTLITELRPAALDQLGLKPALESLLERAGAVEGLDVTGEIEIGPRAPGPGAGDHDLPLRPGGADQRGQARPRRASARAPEPRAGDDRDRDRRRRRRVRSRAAQRGLRPGRDAGARRARRRHDAGRVVGGGHDHPRFVPHLAPAVRRCTDAS